MSDEQRNDSPPKLERRASGLVMQGLTSAGVFLGGVGGLAAGAAKLKETLGGRQSSGDTPQPPEAK